ncbi:KH domain-containing protein [Bdellovibrio svalbardensis]|uniref:RNA-binding protein KhpA n=1 Tax=Bdellovibrio svalbardensis TaxID=2972972 RepID=A0ABT6DE46_9BACT|nr:KH domain-containing protein [Bdellovibrio svalbardensis]MDG0815093.1 KH domain-containing protein [Bdellovibrio svalbardensis]
MSEDVKAQVEMNTAGAHMRTYLEEMVKKIVRNPSDARIEFSQGEKTTVYIAVVNPDDLGLLLGKKGATIDAIRTLVRAMMARYGMRAIVQLDEQLESHCAKSDLD